MKRILIAITIILALMLSMTSIYAATAKKPAGSGCPVEHSGKADPAAKCPVMNGKQTTGKTDACPTMKDKAATCKDAGACPTVKKSCKTKCVKKGKCTVKGCTCCSGKCPATKTCKTKAQCAAYKKAHCKCCQPTKPAIKSTRAVVSAVCPVMGNKIPDVTKAAGKSVYKGKTYYFCCGGCKPKFDANPAKYVK